jgi:hypothetical protein
MNISVPYGYERNICYPKSKPFALLNALDCSTSSKSLSTFNTHAALKLTLLIASKELTEMARQRVKIY